jgi:AcrR family transcriptional regulator
MDVRTRILEAALRLLGEGGAQQITQPRVSKEAGVRQSHLTYYFPTVTDLMQAVARHSFQSLAKELDGANARERPGPLAEVIAKATRDKRRVRLMLGLVQSADRDATLKPGMRRFIGELRAGLTPLLRSAGLEATPQDIAFLHSVVVGCAVLQLARDGSAARAEARAVLEKAIAVLAKERA